MNTRHLNLSPAPRTSSTPLQHSSHCLTYSISFPFYPLRTLNLSCSFFHLSSRLFSITCALFDKNSRGGIPPRDFARHAAPSPAPQAQKSLSASPVFATLAHSLSRNPFACHSYANTRDMGATLAPKFLPGPKDVTPGCSSTSFKINTCKTVSKQTTSSSFRINTYKKQGGGGAPGGTDRPHP